MDTDFVVRAALSSASLCLLLSERFVARARAAHASSVIPHAPQPLMWLHPDFCRTAHLIRYISSLFIRTAGDSHNIH